jgi:hypothetical protein
MGKNKIIATKDLEQGEVTPGGEYKRIKRVIELYKVQNPAKYESKKEALEEQLAKLKTA